MAAGLNLLPYPIYGAPYRFGLPILDNTGHPVQGAGGLDSQISKDSGAFSACTNEAVEVAGPHSSYYYLDYTAVEMQALMSFVLVHSTDADVKDTPVLLFPRKLIDILSGTAQAGTETGVTLPADASAVDDFYKGMFIQINNNTPAGIQGETRQVISYNGGTKVATVTPNWAHTPTSSSTLSVLVLDVAMVGGWAGVALADPNTDGIPAVDAVAISGDETAADNLESQYDTTGVTGDTFPATQLQLGQISLTGAAVSTPAIDAPNGFAITWGENEANDEDDTHAVDGVYHDIEAQNDGGTEKIDVYYEFDIGGDGVPTSVTWQGYLNKGGGAGKNITVQAYNWGGTSWRQAGSINSGTSDSIETFQLFTSEVGTGANLGKVRIRFVTGSIPFSATTLLKTNQIFLSYAIVARSVGYADGAIWIDTNGTNTNTESYVDGTADNPVSTWAAALTISGNLNITRFRIVNGSTITLSGNSDNYTLIGSEWTLDLNGQSCADAYFQGAHVSGICTGAEIIFRDGDLARGGGLNCAGMEAHQCALSGAITLTAANTYVFDRCHSNSDTPPSIDFEDAAENKVVVMTDFHGDLELKNFGHAAGAHQLILTGHGHVTFNANCDAAVAADVFDVHGFFHITDNVAGGWGGTTRQEARYDITQIEQYAGALWYVNGTVGSDTNDGLSPERAFATVGKAISEASAGDKIIVFSGTYTEVTLDLNIDSVWMQGEPGTILVNNAFTPCLRVSGNDCKITGLRANPGANRIGFDLRGKRIRAWDCDSIGGAIGFKLDSTDGYSKLCNCRAIEYTTTGFDILGADTTFRNCLAQTLSFATTGFGLSGDRNTFDSCVSVHNTAQSWSFAGSASINELIRCSASPTCGAIVDAGADNSYTDFRDGINTIAADVVTAMFAKTGITAGGVVSYEDMMKAIYALTRGKIVKTGDSYAVYDDNDTTVLFTLTIATGARSTA